LFTFVNVADTVFVLLFWSRRTMVCEFLFCYAVGRSLSIGLFAAPTEQRFLVLTRRHIVVCHCWAFRSENAQCILTNCVLLLWYYQCVSRHVLELCVYNVRSPSKQTCIMACDRWRVIDSILVSISQFHPAHKMADTLFPSVIPWVLMLLRIYLSRVFMGVIIDCGLYFFIRFRLIILVIHFIKY